MMICTGYLVICTETLMIHWAWKVQLHEKIRLIIPDSDVFYLHQIPISSLRIWTQWIEASVCLRAIERLFTLTQINRILIIQTDLIIGVRCCVERVCLDAVTGSCSGVETEVYVYQCHIRASAGRDQVMSVSFGSNVQSWSLFCSPSRYSFIHSKRKTDLSVESISSRIGVYVDHSAGTLSFYSVSDTVSLIHTVQTTFTQPLYPGFNVHKGSSVKLCWF